MLAVTAAVTAYVAFSIRARDRLRFQNAVEDVRISLERRLETYLALLRATTGLFAASEGVSRQEFNAFVDHLDLPRLYPGVQGIGFSIRVPAAERVSSGTSSWTLYPFVAPRILERR